MSIVTTPHPVLRQVAKPITQVDSKLLDLIASMEKALLAAEDPQGVGLAAPQVGVPLRLFLARPDLRKKPLLFINPEIVKLSQRQQSPNSKDGVYEGCLSIPHHYAPLKRSLSVTLKYQTISPNKAGCLRGKPRKDAPERSEERSEQRDRKLPELIEKSETFTGFLAHIIQHEVDHLNGILFIDHVLSQNAKLYRIHGEEWEELTL